jgi:phage regulator Rha-like protein
MQFKEKYINAFNKMEKALNSITSIKTLPEYEKIRLE